MPPGSRFSRVSNPNTNGRLHQVVPTILTFMFLTLAIYSGWELLEGIITYRMLNSAITEGARFAAARGNGVTVGEIAKAIQTAGEGLEPDRLDITLSSEGHTYACGALVKCLHDGTRWPPAAADSSVPLVTVRAVYSFRTDLASLLPDPDSVTVRYRAEATAF